MSGLTVALTTTKTLSTSVEFTATCMYAGDTGVVIVYKNNSEVSRSGSVTIASGSSASVAVSGLSPHTLYNAVFYSTITQIEASESVSFITTGSRVLYGSVNDKAKKITTLYGGVNNQAEKVTKFYGSVNGETKLIHQGFGHLNYLTLSSVTGSIVPWAGEGISVGSFNGNTFYTKLSTDFPQFLPYSYCDAPIYRLKMVLKSATYPYLADLILQFGGEGNIVAEEILENDVRPISVFDDYGIDANGGGGNVGAASYINLNPIYN